MNSITIEGHLGRAIEIKKLNSQTLGEFTIADKTRDKTIWWDCVIWGDRADKLAPFLVKGTYACVVGDLSEREWVDTKTGVLKRKFTLRVANISFYNRESKANKNAPSQKDLPEDDIPL